MISTLRALRAAQRRPLIPGDASPAEITEITTRIRPIALADLDDLPLMGRAPWRPAPYHPRHGQPLSW